MKRILVTGAGGQLGQTFKKIAESSTGSDAKWIFTDYPEMDFLKPESIDSFLKKQPRFDLIINTAAHTAVDLAESESNQANLINHCAVKQLADYASHNHSMLIHYSTDYVFDGQGPQPYSEHNRTSPINEYGKTKYLGEQAVVKSNCRGAIIRTSWVYSEFGQNFVKTMLRLGRERAELNIIYDQIGTPTYAHDLALTSWALIQRLKDSKKPAELYHFSNEGVCSWYDFAHAIFDFSGIHCPLNPIETKEYPTPAKRPHYSVLNKSKIKEAIQTNIPHWRESLRQCLAEIEKTL